MTESDPKPTVADKKRLDESSKKMLYGGCSISQLGVLFGMDNRTIAKKISACEPCAMRAGFPIYQIKDAAPYLVRPVGDIEEHIKKMHHRDLPPMLLREYWTGQLAKLKFEEEEGDLWRTDDVLSAFAKTFQLLRTELLLLSDSVERETAFSDRQRDLLKSLIDGTIENTRNALEQHFKPAPEATEEDDAEAEFWRVPGDGTDTEADEPEEDEEEDAL